MKQEDIKIGIYEKALPYGLGWDEKLAVAERLDFQFIEMSVDETTNDFPGWTGVLQSARRSAAPSSTVRLRFHQCV